MRPIDFIVIHCSASPPKVDADVVMITRWHRLRGFLTIGYHYVIKRNGVLEEGRALERVGAHAEGFNKSSIGVCLAGGVDAKGRAENNFEQIQFKTLKTLLYTLKCQYPSARIIGHRDLPDVHKDCPSFDVRSWLKEIGLAG